MFGWLLSETKKNRMEVAKKSKTKCENIYIEKRFGIFE